MLRFIRRRALNGFTLIEVMAVTAIMSTLNSQSGGFRYAIEKANEVKGISNLKQIHMMLQIGDLPKAAFYPKGDPKTDPTSIVRLIPDAPQELFVSPFAPEALKKKGLTFAWNDAVGGKDISMLPKDTWLLIDLAAFIADPKIPKPHRYLILYADGRALAVDGLPADIDKVVKEAQAKLKKEQK